MNSGRSARRVLIAFATVVATIGVVLLSAAPASANWSGATNQKGCGPLNVADNQSNTWYDYVLTADTSAALSSVLTYIDNSTAVDEVYDSTLDANTDTVYSDGAYTDLCGIGWYGAGGVNVGYTVCDSLTSWGGCQSHSVYLSTTYLGSSQSPSVRDRAIILHESGHAFGLTHLNVSGEVMQNTVTNITTYSTEDKNHLKNDLRN